MFWTQLGVFDDLQIMPEKGARFTEPTLEIIELGQVASDLPYNRVVVADVLFFVQGGSQGTPIKRFALGKLLAVLMKQGQGIERSGGDQAFGGGIFFQDFLTASSRLVRLSLLPLAVRGPGHVSWPRC